MAASHTHESVVPEHKVALVQTPLNSTVWLGQKHPLVHGELSSQLPDDVTLLHVKFQLQFRYSKPSGHARH